jgi:phosphoenolpyruvate carboxylase
MNEINYEKQITSLHAEVVRLKEELENEKEITKVWLDLATQYHAILEPILDALLPMVQERVHINNVRKAYEQVNKTIIKADHDND